MEYLLRSQSHIIECMIKLSLLPVARSSDGSKMIGHCVYSDAMDCVYSFTFINSYHPLILLCLNYAFDSIR